MAKKIALLVGSLRRDSYNRKIANELIRLAPESLQPEIVEIGDMPFYNEDLETENTPESWKIFREKIRNSDGIIFLTPEYNRTTSAVLKNAIDVGSRPKGEGVLGGKPAAVASLSTGPLAGFGANHNVRQSLVALNMPVMQQPEAYFGMIAKKFSEDGKTVVEDTEKVLKKFIDRYAEWISKF